MVGGNRQGLPTWLAAGLLAVGLAGALPAQQGEDAIDETRDGPYIEKYDNDIHKVEAFYKKGKREGRYQEFWANGRLKIRAAYQDDKRVGLYQEYNEDGKLILQCSYLAGEKDGVCTEYFATGKTKLQSSYAAGLLHGPYRSYREDGRTLEQDTVYIYGVANRFPRKVADIQKEIQTIAVETAKMEVTAPTPAPAPPGGEQPPATGTPAAGGRNLGPRAGGATAADAAALRQAITCLKQARAIAGVPYADLTFKPEYLVESQAATELLAQLGQLDHHPPKPAGMSDERYQLGQSGCAHGNLGMGQKSLSDAQMRWLFDSDDSNKKTVGHRRWSLNPAMLQVGYGQTGKFFAMWAHDTQRAPVPAFSTIPWPAAGYHPVGFFGSDWCWNLSLNPDKFQAPGDKTVKVKMWALDRGYKKTGAPLELNHFCVNNEGYGVRYAVIWRPKTLDVAPGKAYYVEIEGLVDTAGQPAPYNQVTEFIP